MDLAADDLVPLIALVVLESRVTQLCFTIEFVNEFVDKPLPDSTTNLPHLYYRQFADIVFYTLVYIKQHFQSNRISFFIFIILLIV